MEESIPAEDETKIALNLFNEISNACKQVSDIIDKLKVKVNSEDLSFDKGISLLNVKNQLLLQYLINLTYVMMVKTKGQQIEGIAAIERLIEQRVILERMKPLEEKLKYQIDKLIRVAKTGVINENDPSRFRANPSLLLSKIPKEGSDEDESEDEKEDSKKEKKVSGVYVPPRLAPMHYDGDVTQEERKTRLLERARKFALNSSVMQELKEEYLDIPIEVAMTNSAQQKVNKFERYKQEYEENYFTRLPVTKKEKRTNKLSTLGTLGDEITRFEDVSALDADITTLKSSKKRKRSVKKLSGKKKKKRRL